MASVSAFEHGQQILSAGCDLDDERWWHANAMFGSFAIPWRERLPVLRQKIQRAQDLGVCFTFPGAWDFPGELLVMNDPPFFLTYLGEPVWKKSLGLAVVGSREPGAASEAWCEQELPLVLRQLPLFLVSGGARGVDQMAHRVALREGRSTLILVPAGLHCLYPENLQDWVRPVIEGGGALISEYSPQTPMRKHFFAERNRLISGLALATLVVEARVRSGTLLTAKHCLEQGKPLFVLPSHPLDHGNRGALDLMMEGATPVCSAQDLIMMLSGEITTSRRVSLAVEVDSVPVPEMVAELAITDTPKSESF